SGGVYLNDPNQYNSNTAATSFTSLATTPLTASHNLRNGGGVGGGDGSRAKLGGSNRNRLNEIFEEPINISEYINSSPDKDVWLLKLVSKLSNDLNKIFKSSTDFDMVIE
ncbi:13695_t:CDS:1, partial [Entrophospora sp. SA101]